MNDHTIVPIALPTPFPVGPSNGYLVLSERPVLVDCGVDTAAAWSALQSELAAHQLAPADIADVFITHAHVDHMGMAARLAAHGARIWVSEQVEPWARRFEHHWALRVQFIERVLNQYGISAEETALVSAYMMQVPSMWRSVPAGSIFTFSSSGTVRIGQASWQVIYTPGHANTHTVFYRPETGELLGGDLLLEQTPTPVIEQPLEGGDERVPGLPAFLQSLDRVYALPITTVYPGHGDPFGDHRALIERQRTRIAMRTQQVLELVAGGVSTLAALTTQMYPDYPAGYRLTGMGMLIGYLDLLIASGNVKTVDERGICTFRASAAPHANVSEIPPA